VPGLDPYGSARLMDRDDSLVEGVAVGA